MFGGKLQVACLFGAWSGLARSLTDIRSLAMFSTAYVYQHCHRVSHRFLREGEDLRYLEQCNAHSQVIHDGKLGPYDDFGYLLGILVCHSG